jgi:hypothetical protein
VNYPLLYLEHLSEHDLDLMIRAGARAEPLSSVRSRLREEPNLIDQMLASPPLFEAVFGSDDPELRWEISPFLAFGILVNRASADLRTASYVTEWTGPSRRLPLFDVESLRELIEDGARRYFLIELLSSFTRVASGSMWVRTRRGYRRRRYSELDPVRLAEVVAQMPPAQRPAGYRRLGDVALFLTGVFPDHTAAHPLLPRQRDHLARSAGLSGWEAIPPAGLGLYEEAGAGWYRRAVEAAQAAVGAGPPVLLDVADHFQPARRFLNFLTDRYLFRFESGLMRPAG